MGELPHGLRRLTKRQQFLNAARGKRAGRAHFTVQATGVPQDAPGLGLTVTKKTGSAPARNRIKRRLRAAAGACAQDFKPQHDYVLIGRRDALGAPFPVLVSELSALLGKVHAQRPDASRKRP